MGVNNDLWKWNNQHWHWKIIWQWSKWWFKEKLYGGSSDSITKYINFHDIIKERRANYPFAIFNIDRENKPRTHWWSFLDIYPKKDLFLFEGFGFAAFKEFIVDNDINIVDKLLFNLKKFDKKDTKINLVSLTCSVENYRKIKEKNQEKLTNTAKDFFHLLSEFGKLKKRNNEAKIIVLDDQLQERTAATCGIFQQYFYNNLLDSDSNSKKFNDEFLTKKTVTILLNDLLRTIICVYVCK